MIPQALAARELAHQGLTELRVVDSMHERKATMAGLSDAFLALPGGYGTWDEFCEVLTWSQLGIQRKPCALLNVNQYYDFFLHFAVALSARDSCARRIAGCCWPTTIRFACWIGSNWIGSNDDPRPVSAEWIDGPMR